jgi:hypothetical protein
LSRGAGVVEDDEEGHAGDGEEDTGMVVVGRRE